MSVRLELKGVTKVHRSRGREVTALDGIELTVEPGELLVLLGPSGCGKSTLLELLAGLEQPTSGEIRFGDRIVAAPARGVCATPKERNVAMVFQSYALYPHLTVGENIAFPLRASGFDAGSIPAAVRQAAEAVQIEEILAARPAELSGGQRQRVAIARAIVRKPSLFLMDEPLSNLDARLRTATRGRIKELQRNLGVTTVYVTHDQQEAMALGDRVAVLKGGRVEQIGSPSELHSHPASAFVARFTGSPPMNLLRMRRASGGSPLLEHSGTGWMTPAPSGYELNGLGPASTVLLGIRPEHVSLADPGAGNGPQVRVVSVEAWGRESLVHLASGNGVLAVLHPGRAPMVGENLGLAYDPERAMVFADDGED